MLAHLAHMFRASSGPLLVRVAVMPHSASVRARRGGCRARCASSRRALRQLLARLRESGERRKGDHGAKTDRGKLVQHCRPSQSEPQAHPFGNAKGCAAQDELEVLRALADALDRGVCLVPPRPARGRHAARGSMRAHAIFRRVSRDSNGLRPFRSFVPARLALRLAMSGVQAKAPRLP
jgi:hypothetical protein